MAFPLQGPALGAAAPGPAGVPPPPLPFLGIAPPPIGPRLPDPKALDNLRAGIDKLLDAAQDPLVAKAINKLTRSLMDEYQALRQPPKPSPEEAAAGGPLDHTPQGDVGGIPLQTLLPRLAGVGERQ